MNVKELAPLIEHSLWKKYLSFVQEKIDRHEARLHSGRGVKDAELKLFEDEVSRKVIEELHEIVNLEALIYQEVPKEASLTLSDDKKFKIVLTLYAQKSELSMPSVGLGYSNLFFMSNDKTEATESLTENSENLSEDTETNDLDLFDDDSSEEQDDAHETIDWEARAKKAEKKIVDLKKSKSSTPDIDSLLEEKIATREFYKENPEAKALEKEIQGYTKKGISLEEAFYLVQKKQKGEDRTAKQERSNRATLSGNSAPTQSQITLSELDKLPYAEHVKAMEGYAKGELKIK